MPKPPFALFYLLPLGVLGLLLIIQNVDYSHSSGEASLRQAPRERLSGVSAEFEEEGHGWQLLAVSNDQGNPTYINRKNMVQQGDILFFWRKQVYDLPPAGAGVPSGPSIRTGELVYKAQEQYQADCRQMRVRGPVQGLYWNTRGKPILFPKTGRKEWKFKSHWSTPDAQEAQILQSVCHRDTGQVAVSEQSHE